MVGNGKPRVLMVLEAGDAFPSGFIRGLIYREAFRENGYTVKYVNRNAAWMAKWMSVPPLWPAALHGPGMRKLLVGLAKAWARIAEIMIVRLARRFDVVYLSKVMSRQLVERLRSRTRARLVLDFGDAVWMDPVVGDRFVDMVKRVDAVTTDNALTADWIRQWNARCTVIPDCPQVEAFDRRRASRNPDRKNVVLGWVGTPGTAYNLFLIWEVLERLSAKYSNLSLRLVGVERGSPKLPPFERVRFSCRPSYNQEDMIEEVLGMDIGLFPQFEVEASRVRGVLKATVYMAGGMPVICSAVGQCPEAVREDVNGMLARTPREWEEKLSRLIEDPFLRRRIGEAGLDTVRTAFTLDASFARLTQVLQPDDRVTPHGEAR